MGIHAKARALQKMSSVVMRTAFILLGRICKRSFISSVRTTVKSSPSRTRSSNPENLKTLAFCFRVDGTHLQNGAFQKRWRYDNQMDLRNLRFQIPPAQGGRGPEENCGTSRTESKEGIHSKGGGSSIFYEDF